jgi:hypothetical protein
MVLLVLVQEPMRQKRGLAMNRLSIILLVAFTLAVSACAMPTYFRHPVSPPGTASYDERLIGTWIARGDDDQIFHLAIEPSEVEGEENFLMIAFSVTRIDPGTDGKAAFVWLNRIAYPSAIDGGTYYNIRAPGYGGGSVEPGWRREISRVTVCSGFGSS